MKFHTLATLLSFAASIAGAFAQQTPSLFPYEPAQLLGVLPAAPAEWKVLRSDAEVTLGEWLETKATRTFQSPPSTAGAADGSANPGLPGEIEINVTDTAGFAPALAAFANFAPVKNGNFEKKLFGTLPAIVITGDNGRQFVQVLVGSRYLVSLTLTNLPRHRAEDWLRTFHFETLPPASKTPTSQPREFRLSHLDELQSKNNRSYVVSTTNARRVDAFLKTLPAAAPEPAVAESGANSPPGSGQR